MAYALIFIIGLIFGSFFNVLIYRLPREIGYIFGRSQCPECKKILDAQDLVPLFSYIISKGRCRHCGTKIAPRYFIVELISGLIFLGLFIVYGAGLKYIFSVIFFGSLLIIFFSDLETKIIPDEIIIILAVLGVMGLIESRMYLDRMWGFIFGGGILIIIGFIGEKIFKKESMGGGDIKLMAVLGLILGLKNIIFTLFLSFVIGSIIGIMYMAFMKKGLKDYIPFGPAIIISASISYFYGYQIIEWYLGTI